METFEFSGDYIDLNKLLKVSGLCESGGMAKMEIGNGLVSVDGIVEYRKRCKIRNGQTVECGGRTIKVVNPGPDGTES